MAKVPPDYDRYGRRLPKTTQQMAYECVAGAAITVVAFMFVMAIVGLSMMAVR